MVPYLNYELTTIPTPLFQDYAMRKPAKAQLAKSLTSNVQPGYQTKETMHVLDGGALLHKVKWAKNMTYKDLAIQYATYVRIMYELCCIVFDGYDQGPSIKDHEHQKRVGKTFADIQLHETMQAHGNQGNFLSNEKYKSQFISLISHYLQADGQNVHISSGDADTLIVACALQFAAEGKEVCVVADDTDVLVLLMYHWNPNMADIYFYSEAKGKQKQKDVSRVWKIHDLVT